MDLFSNVREARNQISILWLSLGAHLQFQCLGGRCRGIMIYDSELARKILSHFFNVGLNIKVHQDWCLLEEAFVLQPPGDFLYAPTCALPWNYAEFMLHPHISFSQHPSSVHYCDGVQSLGSPLPLSLLNVITATQ